MRRAIVRSIVVGLLALIGAAFPAAWLAFAEQPAPSPAEQPLSERDREFIVVIRYANLWEIPMGQLGIDRGVSKPTKDAGAAMLADHTQLNVDVEKLANQFGVKLPDQPTSQQQAWIAEIQSKTGEEFDRVFANRLRAAHGTVFGLVGEVRAGTKNSIIRGFAESAVNIVMKHMRLLEGTGHVMPTGLFAEASARTTNNPENQLGRGDIVLAGVLGIIALAATIGFVRAFSGHGAR